jgi:hypothetical protein
MIKMRFNSLIQQHNMNWLICHITMKVVSADSSCSVVWWGARAACAEVARRLYGLLEGQHSPRATYGAQCIQTNMYCCTFFVILVHYRFILKLQILRYLGMPNIQHEGYNSRRLIPHFREEGFMRNRLQDVMHNKPCDSSEMSKGF